MSLSCKFTELAVDGKWISLARLWLEENTPCSRERMFVELGMLMPSTIRVAGVLAGRSQLVANAYRRIYGSNDIPDSIGCPKRKPIVTGATQAVRTILANNDTVKYSELKHIKNGGTLLRQLLSRGECERIAPGIYKKTLLLKTPVVELTPAGS